MNYYPHHIGDYAQATAHLSFVEDAAFCRLLRKYYAEETPLPSDMRTVQRLACARTEEERAAVEMVLTEFFVLRDDGWHNNRADEEIAKAREKSAKATASIMRRWGKSNNQRNTNVLPTNPENSSGVLPANFVRNTNVSEIDTNVSVVDTRVILPNPTPTPKLEEKIHTVRTVCCLVGTGPVTPVTPSLDPELDHEPDPCPPEAKPERQKAERERRTVASAILELLNIRTGKNFRADGKNIELVAARLREGYTEAELRGIVAHKCRVWLADSKMSEYLRPKTLFGKENCAQYVGELKPRKPMMLDEWEAQQKSGGVEHG